MNASRSRPHSCLVWSLLSAPSRTPSFKRSLTLLFQTDGLDSHRSRTPPGYSALPSFPPLQKESAVSHQLHAMQAEGELLLAALRRYLSMAKPAEQQEPPAHLRPPFNNRMETPGPKKESSKSRPVMPAKAPVGSIRDPLTSVDGGFSPRSTFRFWLL